MGSGDRKKMKRTATDGIILSLIFVAVISGAGLLTLNPLFLLLGASGHAGLLDLSFVSFRERIDSWKLILHVGLPSAMTQLLVPLTRAVVTKLAAYTGGALSVAAVAAGSRIEGFAGIFVMSYSMALVPIIGQNWGGGRMERIKEISLVSRRMAGVYGSLFFLAALFLSGPVATLLTQDPVVKEMTALYLKIVAASSAAMAFYS
ncbi:MAG: hypothetical protein JXR86_02310, partial [Spirochaetales bacterium]|nr:hypothetical protein [Spirochaetales bacterium]